MSTSNPPPRPRRRLVLGSLGAAAAALALPAAAAPGGLPSATHSDSSPEWERLRDKLFGNRPIVAYPSQVQLVVPLRAAYGASVPVKVVSKLPPPGGGADVHVRRMTLLVDKNPSAIAAVFDMAPGMRPADIETRLRVDEYSHIRVIHELSNGELHMDSRYVKVSGGCSAPPNRDQLHNIGKTQFKLPQGVVAGQVTPVDLQVVHPNDTGFELNNVTVMFIPPHFVRSIKVTYDERKLFDADLDFSISENPAFRFHFIPQGPGVLRAAVEDSKEGRYEGSLAVL